MHYRSLFSATVQTVGLFVAGFVIPVLGQIVALFTPVPLILLYARNGTREGLLAVTAASAIIGVAGGWLAAAIFFLSFGLMAIGIAEGVRRQWKPEAAALLGGLLPILVVGLAGLFYFYQVGKNPIPVTEEYLRESLSEAAKLYTQLKLTEVAASISSIPDSFIYYLVRLIPGITIATSVVQAACCYGVSRAIIIRRPESETAVNTTSLREWHAPDVWVWGLIAALALSVIPHEGARFAGWNFAIIYSVVYLTQGVAVVDHYLHKAHIQIFVRGLIHALLLMLPSVVFIIALGIVDIWADVRKVRGPVQPL